MMRDDRGISELMGYTALIAVVSIASVALLAGSLGALSQSEMQIEYEGSAASMRSFAQIVDDITAVNNTFDTAYQMSVPPGYDLIVRDRHDDYHSLGIYANSARLAFLPMGSAALCSPFRSIVYEGGAVTANDSGLFNPVEYPRVHMSELPSGRKVLYVYVTALSSDMPIMHSGVATLYARCVSVTPLSWHLADGSKLDLYVRGEGLEAWKDAFEEYGLTTAYASGALKASATDVSDLYVAYAEAEVHA